MSNVFEHLAYRPLFQSEVQRCKQERIGWTLQKIAAKAQIQPPYLTNVLKERAHLSADQLYSLAQVLGMDNEQSEYASLLLEWERSGNPRRREKLQEKIEKTRREKLQTKANLKKELIDSGSDEYQRFFLNPQYSLVNAFLGIPRFAKQPGLIASCLGLTPRQLQRWLQELVRMKFLKPKDGSYERARTNFHLPPESPLCEPHQHLLQQLASQQVQRLPDDKKYIFQLTFSADPKTREKIHREFLGFLKRIEPLVKEAPEEELYGLRFDLFQWSHDPE